MPPGQCGLKRSLCRLVKPSVHSCSKAHGLTHILAKNLSRLALDGHGRPAAYGGSDGGPQGLIPGLAETESFCCSPLRFPDARKGTVLG